MSNLDLFGLIIAGNEQEHISGVVSLLNSELDGYDNDDERMERYKELVELYKEYNENGWKVKHRRHTKQAFPNEVRTKRGREITFASVSCNVNDYNNCH